MDGVRDRIRTLRDKRSRVASELAQSHVDLPTHEELMPLVRERLADLEATLLSDLKGGRLALGALLGDRRIRV